MVTSMCVGLLHFRFWRFGRWMDVYIDDRLPVDADNKLIYAKCQESNEFWVSLLEKAYAKCAKHSANLNDQYYRRLHGTYAALEGGQAMDALVDLTAGLAERYELAQATSDLYQKLATARASDAFITCSRKVALVLSYACAHLKAHRATGAQSQVRLMKLGSLPATRTRSQT